MDVVIALEHRFSRTPDGAVWTSGPFDYSFWQRYLDTFDRVRVVARTRDVSSVPHDWKQSNGDNVEYAVIPYYVGPMQYIRRARQIRAVAQRSVGSHDAVVLRVGSQIASTVEHELRRTNHPFGVEVVGDPFDTFAPGAVQHPLRAFFRWWFTHQLQRQCWRATAAAYVTEDYLQRRYPASPNAFTTHYSSVELADEAFAECPKIANQIARPIRLMTIGSLDQMYKAPDVQIDAVKQAVHLGLDVQLFFIGDGRHRAELEDRVRSQGLSDRIHFLGQVPSGSAVRAQLDQATLFILPSRTEGLPRALIEAMARGLPCIGSTVGGMPELLPTEDMVPPGDASALAIKIREVVTDPERMARMAIRNFEKANEYRVEILRERRIAFYRYLRDRTEEWTRNGGAR